jgi:DNA-binding CsgD family transcriptional regulator/tetratricopeptide (TPR) repeat protein
MTASSVGDPTATPEVHRTLSSKSGSARLRQTTADPDPADAWIPSALGRSRSGGRLIGRASELEQLDALIRAGSGALLLNGEAGIGKSALLGRARDRATELGARALVAVGVESEAELAFAGMHQLLRPINGTVEQLPSPQRRALEAAFGIASDVEPDPFLVALAAHQLVCDAAEVRPLALIVDDAQWLDRSSLGVLSFIARRLESEPVVLIAAVRDGYVTPLEEARLPTLRLERLSAAAAAELLDRSAPDLAPIVRARVLAGAAGNPLALVELARSLPPLAATRDRLSLPPPTLTARLEQAFAARLDDLPEQVRLMLLAAALDGSASLADIAEAAGLLYGSQTELAQLDAAVDAELIEIVDAELRFRHPLKRSAVTQAAPAAQVRAMHGGLAKVVVDPERQLWHRAMAAVGPDEELAEALDAHAAVARRRGAAAVAAAALERAAALTPEPVRRGERLIRAAEVAYELGLVEIVRRLLQQAESVQIGPLEAARSAWLGHMISGDVWVQRGAAKAFVEISRQMHDGGDIEMALRSLVPIAHRCWWTRPSARTRKYVIETVEGFGVPEDDPLLLAVVALAHPELAGPKVLDRVSRMTLRDFADPSSLMYLGIAAEKAGDHVAGGQFLGRAIERLREQGRIGMLTEALVYHAGTAIYTGAWAAAEAAGSEAARLARDSGQPQFGLTGAILAAHAAALRGDAPDLDALLVEPERTLRAMNSGSIIASAHLARASAALGDGRHEEAYQHLWPVFDESDPAFHRFLRWRVVLDLAEAATHGERAPAVAGVIDELEEIASQSSPPILCANLACARPLLAVDDEVEMLFRMALREDHTGYPFLRARTLFSFGCWLRRQRRSAESRKPLRDSIDLFDALGATTWSMRARRELRATGETIGPRTPDARDRLTAQEMQIASLAARGLSNREIGERLFLSHRTIGSHLYRIFPKLDVTSRAQLRDALAERAEVSDEQPAEASR